MKQSFNKTILESLKLSRLSASARIAAKLWTWLGINRGSPSLDGLLLGFPAWLVILLGTELLQQLNSGKKANRRFDHSSQTMDQEFMQQQDICDGCFHMQMSSAAHNLVQHISVLSNCEWTLSTCMQTCINNHVDN